MNSSQPAKHAGEAVAETGLGRLEDKIAKNRLVAEKTPGTEDLVPRARSGDRGLSLIEPAPYGVIGAITPVTNPTSTIICNTIGMVAAGNGVVFNVHPSAKVVSVKCVHLINRAIMTQMNNLHTSHLQHTTEYIHRNVVPVKKRRRRHHPHLSHTLFHIYIPDTYF